MRLALRQPRSAAGDLARAMADLRADLATARAGGADLLLLPELYFPGYNVADMAGGALDATSPLWSDLSSAVRQAGVALAFGHAEAEGEAGAGRGRLYNSATVLSPHGLPLARYRKVQLYGPREAALFTPGDRLVTFDLMGRRAALLICYDVEFADHLRTLAHAGVDLVLVPTANMMPYTTVADHLVPAHAAAFGLTIAYANLCGVEGDLTYAGGSVVAGPDGAVVAKAGQGPALLIVDLPDPLPAAARPTFAGDLRPAGV